MEENGLHESTNLIVLSDHGLARIVEEEQFYLEECLSDYSNVSVIAFHINRTVRTNEERVNIVNTDIFTPREASRAKCMPNTSKHPRRSSMS